VKYTSVSRLKNVPNWGLVSCV